jgi:hypothetical protein
MVKKALLASSAPIEVTRIPVPFGGAGRTSGQHNRVGVVEDRGKHRLSLSLRTELHSTTEAWRFVTAEFLSNDTVAITGVEFKKAERGFSVRRNSNGRPQFIIPFVGITVTPVDHGEGDDGDVTDTIGDDGSIKFTLPPAIKGRFGWFKLSRS